MLRRSLTFGLILVWMSSTATSIAMPAFLGYTTLAIRIDVLYLLSGFLYLTLNALIVVFSTLFLRRFEFRYAEWYIIPLGFTLTLYGSSLYVVFCFLRYVHVELFMWLSFAIGISLASMGMYAFARIVYERRPIRASLLRKTFIVTTIILILVTSYSTVTLALRVHIHTMNLNSFSVAVHLVNFLVSVGFFTILSLPKVHTPLLSKSLDLFACGIVSFGLFGLTDVSYMLSMDVGSKILSQALGVIAPSMVLASIILTLRVETEILDVCSFSSSRGVLLELNPTGNWLEEVVNSIKREREDRLLVLITRPASILASYTKSDVIALTDSSFTYPQSAGASIYRVSPEATYIVNFVDKIKREVKKPVCLVFDNLTDVIVTLGVKEGYKVARDVLGVLDSQDVAIFIVFPKAHSESEITLIRTLFAQRIEVT
ncbi:MAG: hypothetical protein QW701_03055 [Candidatus Nezhaarchaeales archaeon]